MSKKHSNKPASFRKKSTLIFWGILLGFITGILGNIIASWIQTGVLQNKFSTGSVIFIIAASLIGVIISTIIYNRNSSENNIVNSSQQKHFVLSNIFLWSSKLKTRGEKIHIDNLTSIGSKIDIDTEESSKDDD